MAARLLLLLACICGWLYASADSSASEVSKLIVRGSDNYPPFEFINNAGEPDGFNVDLFHALMEELGYSYELELENFDSVAQNIREKKIDVALGMIYSPERAAYGRFALPSCSVNRNYITRESDNYTSFDELMGKEIIVEKNGWFHHFLLNNDFGVSIVECEDIEHALKMLVAGKGDAVLTNDLLASYVIKKHGFKGLRIGNMEIAPQDYSMVVNQDNDDLLYQMNLGLQRLKMSGAYDQIYNKWFSIYESNVNKKVILIAFGVFLLIAVWLIAFVLLLRMRVARATRLLNYSKQEVGIAIDAGNISAWAYTMKDRTINALHGRLYEILGGAATIDEVYEKIHPDDFDAVREVLMELSTGKRKSVAASFRIREKENAPYRYVETKMVWVEATRELPARIVGTLKDITNEVLSKCRIEDYRMKTEFIVRTNGIILIQYDIIPRLFTRINDIDLPNGASYDVKEYLAMVHPDDIEIANRFIEIMDEACETEIETEFRVITETGAYDWYIITAIAYKYDKQDNIISYLGMRRNNTKWKKINSDLIYMKEKADASNRLKSAFLANMSHEIRTPLNAIVGFSELIADTDELDEREKFINIVKTNNALLLQLIDDILDLSRIESGHITFTCEVFNFAEYFQELGASLKIKDTEKVKLVCVNRYDELQVCSDQKKISQVITNFVTNAFKFTREGTITMDYVYESGGVKIMVTDTGIGISAENQARVFDRFEKINDFAQGTGLGLSICKEIALALHGDVGVESELGIGSTFWFWLPCHSGEGEELAEDEMPVLEISSLASDILEFAEPGSDLLFNKKTILIAEDIDNNYLIIRSILKDGYNTIRAENGLEAVEKAKLYNPDIILMDMKMPLMGGLEATKMIREFNAEIPIIALTAYVFDTNKQDALDAGCNYFLTKPVDRSVLMHMLSGTV